MITNAGRELIIDVLQHAATGGSVPVPAKHFDSSPGTRITFQRNTPFSPADILQRLFESLGFPRDLVTQYIADISQKDEFPSFTNISELMDETGPFQSFLVKSCFELFNCMIWFSRQEEEDDAELDEESCAAVLADEMDTIRSLFGDNILGEANLGDADTGDREIYMCFVSSDEKRVLATIRLTDYYPLVPPTVYLQPLSGNSRRLPPLMVAPSCTKEISAACRRAVMDAAIDAINNLAGPSGCLVPLVSAISGAISTMQSEASASNVVSNREEELEKRQQLADQRKAFVGALTGKAKDSDEGQDRFVQFSMPEKTVMNTVESVVNEQQHVRREYLARNPDLDGELKESWEALRAGGSLSSKRADLPAYQTREELRLALHSHNVVVIGGETGSGKTTQVPQYVYEFMCEEGRGSSANIVCTQPRRLAATSVALRVAEERDEAVGGTVGFSIRLENCVSKKTQITYCTTGIVLRRLQTDKFLGRVSHIVVDEIHERGVDTDFLLILLRELLTKRQDLKVILMSATMDSELFARYFGDAPIISIKGRTFPVEVLHLEHIIPAVNYHLEYGCPYEKPSSNKDVRRRNTRKNALSLDLEDAEADEESLEQQRELAKKISASAETLDTIARLNLDVINYELVEHIVLYIEKTIRVEGAVLVFLPGMAEILRCMNQLMSNAYLNRVCIFYNLHSSLGSSEQQGVFKRPPPGKRKIILGTNIMETSITIDDAVFVIDTGKAKENRYNARKSLSELVTVNVSKANCRQRQGRAGRVREGFCFRLFTESQFETFADHQLCEMHRVPLESLILQIYALHLGDEVEYLQKALSPPEEKAIHSSVKVLTTLGALTAEKRLTSLGKHLANLPLDVRVGKMIIHGALLQCLDPVLTMAACLSTRSPFTSSMDFRTEVEGVRRSFAADYHSDQLASWFAYSKWISTSNQQGSAAARKLCAECYMSLANLTLIQSTKKQYERFLYESGFIDSVEGRRVVPNRFILPPHVTLDGKVYEAGGEHFNANSNSARCILACLVAGLYPNIARLKPRRKSATTGKEIRFLTFDGSDCLIHPSSVAGKDVNFRSKLFVYVDKVKTSATFLRDVSMVSSLHVILFSGGNLEYLPKYQELCVDEMTAFICKEDDATLLTHIKNQLDSALTKKINDPSQSWESVSSVVVRAIVKLLRDEGSSTSGLTIIDRREPRVALTESLVPEEKPSVQAPPSDQPFKTNKSCFICGGTGHVSRYCPHNSVKPGSCPSVRCFICGQWHFPQDCDLVLPFKR